MKTVLGIVSVLIVLLITVFILKRQKKCSSCSSKETLISKPKTPEQEKQQSEIKSTAKIAVNSEAVVVDSQVTDTTSISSPVAESVKPVSNIEISAKPQVKEAAVSPVENSSSGFPQDSILRRHYFTHLCTMIEALAPECPTDSILCRHYYMMLLTEIDRCLNDKKAMERLIYDYENLSA